MEIKSIEDLKKVILEDAWMMEVLRTVKSLNLPDWMIGAGFLRSKVWDTLHDFKERTPLPDIDIIYFKPVNKEEVTAEWSDFNFSSQEEIKFEKILFEKIPDQEWSVTNQARMHLVKNREPYKNSEEGLAEWVEIPTCVAVKLNNQDKLEIIAPHGVEDLFNLIVRRTPGISLEVYQQRMKKKNWKAKWPKLKILKN